MDKLQNKEIDKILNDILGEESEGFDILEDILDEGNSDKREVIKKDLQGLMNIFIDEPYYNFLVNELEEIEDIKLYINKYYIGIEILLSIGYYKLYNDLEKVISIYMRALDFKLSMNSEVINVGSLDNLIELMRCDYADKRALIDRASVAFSVDMNQKYTYKLNDINNKLIEIQKAQIKGEKCNNDIDITPKDFRELLKTIDEVVFRIQNMLKINWKFTVNNLEK
ncbi:MAG: hypothetical protein ACRCWM_10230 [Sarcina sp.]